MNEHTATSETGHAAVFVDLCDYTRLTERYGDEAAAQMAVVLGVIARDIARRNNGRVVKMLGDGAHLHFDRAADAVPAAIDFLARVRSSGLPCARVGVNAGPMVEANGDYYGRAVNVAARIAAQAGPGDVLVGETVTWAGAGVRFECVGPMQLRGIEQPVTVYRAFASV
jgi:class 3 adenylate cyclase